MVHLERAILITLTCWGLACAIYWTAGVVQFVRTRLRTPLATDGEKLPEPAEYPSVCVVVPAHNEERVIGELLATLAGQDYPRGKLRVVFSLDRCSDGTERVLRGGIAPEDRERLIVHVIDRCPPEWAGKVHALWHAVMNRPEAFDADLLLFVDADTLLHRSCVRWCVKLRAARGCGLLSLYTTLAKRFWFEHVVQPAAAGELLRQYPLLRAARPGTRNMANGQFMLFTREAYFKVGTHKAVQDEVLEDTALAQRVKGVGEKVEMFFADGAVVCRMYDTWPDFVRGWRRLYIELANRRPDRMAKHAWTALLTGAAMPVLAAASAASGALWQSDPSTWWYALVALVVGAYGFAAYSACLALGVAWGGASAAGVVLYPAGSALVSWILHTARKELVAGVPVKWAGKEYPRTPRYGAATPIRTESREHLVPDRGLAGLGAEVVIVARREGDRVGNGSGG